MAIQIKTILYIILSLAFVPSTSIAQHHRSGEKKPFVLGVTEEIKSTKLGETRVLNVYLPQGYSPDSAATYPVIYLLDGSADEDFIHITGIVQFLSMIVDTMPRAIVVGIANTDRKRDMTFPTTIAKDKADYPTTGGSAKFIAFIEKELQPYIHKHYKTNGSKTLIGQSLGGLLATEILLKKPDLFDQYMIVSPSLWWSGGSLLLEPLDKLKHSHKKLHIFISVGTEGEQMESDARKLVAILHQSARPNLQVDFVPMPDENHLTILHHAAYKGFEVLFSKSGNK